MSKPRLIKDFEKLEQQLQERIKLTYPYGFDRHLITFKNIEGKFVSALPFETDDKYYLVRMTKAEAREIILQDDDYDSEGNLRGDVKEEYEDKYDDLDLEEDIVDDFDSDDDDVGFGDTDDEGPDGDED